MAYSGLKILTKDFKKEECLILMLINQDSLGKFLNYTLMR